MRGQPLYTKRARSAFRAAAAAAAAAAVATGEDTIYLTRLIHPVHKKLT